MLSYKGYTGKVEYNDEARIFHGEVHGLKDVITFQGTTVDELEHSFQESIDDYLTWCQERGEEAEKPFSGKFLVRLPPEIHKDASIAAQEDGLSLNEFVKDAITHRLHRPGGGQRHPRL